MTSTVEISFTANTEALDERLRALRLLMSQIGFALDNYLSTRPSPDEEEA